MTPTPTSSLLSVLTGLSTDSVVSTWVAYMDANCTADLTGLSVTQAEQTFLKEKLSDTTTDDHILTLWRRYLDDQGYSGVSDLRAAIDALMTDGGFASLTETYGDTQDAIMGITDPTTTASRTDLSAYESAWAGYITGTAATMQASYAFNPSAANIFYVSVDGGAYTATSISSGVLQLFTGLSDTEHFVVVTPNAGAGAGNFTWINHAALSITGTGTSRIPAYVLNMTDTNMPEGSILQAHGYGVNWVPANFADGTGSNQEWAGNVPSAAIKGAFTEILIMCSTSDKVFVSEDGGTPTVLTAGTGHAHVVQYTPSDEAVHTFHIWGNAPNGLNGGMISVATFQEPQALTQNQMHHFGHSWVQGSVAGGPGYIDTWISAARNGYCLGNMGLSGDTVAGLDSRMAVRLATTSVGANDVAIVDIGTNDTPTSAMTAGAITAYNSILDALVAEGYGTILCMGVVEPEATDFSPWNSDLESLVTTYANPKVIFVDRTGYTLGNTTGNIEESGGHPSAQGYLDMAALNATTWESLI